MMMSDKDRLFKTIQMYDFTLYELNLYLDTHPRCTHALAQYKKYAKLLNDATNEYNSRFGSITANSVSKDATMWDWSTTPFPWERSLD